MWLSLLSTPVLSSVNVLPLHLASKYHLISSLNNSPWLMIRKGPVFYTLLGLPSGLPTRRHVIFKYKIAVVLNNYGSLHFLYTLWFCNHILNLKDIFQKYIWQPCYQALYRFFAGCRLFRDQQYIFFSAVHFFINMTIVQKSWYV